MFVTGTSAVGARYQSVPSSLKRSASNFGSWPVPKSDAAFTMNGGRSSV